MLYPLGNRYPLVVIVCTVFVPTTAGRRLPNAMWGVVRQPREDLEVTVETGRHGYITAIL